MILCPASFQVLWRFVDSVNVNDYLQASVIDFVTGDVEKDLNGRK